MLSLKVQLSFLQKYLLLAIYNNVLLQRFWQGLAGLLTAVLILKFFNSSTQGWYYSFLSVSSYWIMFEAGLQVVLIQKFAKFFDGCSIDNNSKIIGKNSTHCYSLLNKSFKAYGVIIFFYWAIVWFVGFKFFHYLNFDNSYWTFIWSTIIIFYGFNLILTPLYIFEEAVGNIQKVYKVKLLQGILSSVCIWLIIIFDGGLWSVVPPAVISFGVGFLWIVSQKKLRTIFVDSFSNYTNVISWPKDIWKLQWQHSLNFTFNFILISLHVPLILYFKGADMSGRAGLTLAIVTIISLISQSWTIQKFPEMVTAANKKNWSLLNDIFTLSNKMCFSFYAIGVLLTILLAFLIINTNYSDRILGLASLIGLLGFQLNILIINNLGIKLRAFGEEPFFMIYLVTIVIILPASIIVLYLYNVQVMIYANYIITSLVSLPLAYNVYRKFIYE